jgi:hypothetical protein
LFEAARISRGHISDLDTLDEKKFDAMWKEYEDQAKDIERRKDGLIDDLEGRLSQNTEVKKLFAIRWKII